MRKREIYRDIERYREIYRFLLDIKFSHISNYIESRYIALRYIISDWINARCKAFLLYRCIIFKLQKCTKYKLHKKYTVILYYYSIFSCHAIRGRGLHFRTNIRLPERAYLMFPCLDHHFEFDTHFDKTLKNQHFHHFLYRQKSSKMPSKILSAHIK